MTITLTTFVPGTKAKADEVNANFTALKDAVNEKASISGDNSQVFSVANGTDDFHAINKNQLDELSNDLTAELNKTGTKFCVKSGHTTNGEGDLFSYNGLIITAKIGSTYGNLIFSDYKGNQTTISSTNILSMSGKPNGDHNIFITSEGTLYSLNNTIYRQGNRPSMIDGDVWFDTSVEPFNCIKYDGTNDIEFLDMPLGKVTIINGAINVIKTFPFNQNGYNVTVRTTKLLRPYYANGVTKPINTVNTAEADGIYEFVVQFITGNSTTVTVKLNNATYVSYPSSAGGSFATTQLRLNKGDEYHVTSSHNTIKSTFYPYIIE